ASQNKICTREEAIQAETEASSLKDWDAVYRSFKRFSHCDDAAIGEGYSDVVGRLLTTDWAHFHAVERSFSFFLPMHAVPYTARYLLSVGLKSFHLGEG
ncbi:MAG TPA: hypothetical protein VGP06_18215, partial [Janthinobacterium sp.]|nr:hypothetical protein [Janthinobacterium sp.]